MSRQRSSSAGLRTTCEPWHSWAEAAPQKTPSSLSRPCAPSYTRTFTCGSPLRLVGLASTLLSIHGNPLACRPLQNDFVKDEMRMKSTVRKMRPVVYATESRALLDLISKYPTA